MKLDRRFIRNLVAAGMLLFFLIYAFMNAGGTFVDSIRPIAIGIAMAYLLNILVSWLDKHDILYKRRIIRSEKVHRVLCMIIALLMLAAALTLIGGYIIPMLTDNITTLLGRVPGGIRYLLNLPFVTRFVPEDTLQPLRDRDWNNWINELVSTVNSDDLVKSMTSTASSAFSAFSTISFSLLFMIYFLAGRYRFHRQLVRVARAFLPDGREERFFHYTGMLNACFHDFIVCQVIQALIMCVVSTIFLMVFRLPYAMMIGILSGICSLLPIIGGYIAAAMGTLMILADSPDMALIFLVLIIVIQNVVGTLVFPRLASQSMGLPAVWTLAAVTIGSGMAGFTGIVIGVPLTAFVYRCLGELVRKREAAENSRGKTEENPAGERANPGEDPAVKAASESTESTSKTAETSTGMSVFRRIAEKYGEKRRFK